MGCYLKSTVNNISHQIKGNEESISGNPLSQSWEILIRVLRDLTVLTPTLKLGTFTCFFFPSQKCVQLPLELELIFMSIIFFV